MAIYTSEQLSNRKIKEGEIIWVAAVSAVNILRDFREILTNTFGGRMQRYEKLVNMTLERAFAALEEKAKAQGYDGCVAVRISHPRIADGACEIIVYGTAFHFLAEDDQ